MANPPFSGDTSDPADNGVVSQFPANERAHRDEIISYLDTEHDSATGYHKFQLLTTAQKNSLSSPPMGMFVFDTTLDELDVNTGTPASPVWTVVVQSVKPGTILEFASPSAPT